MRRLQGDLIAACWYLQGLIKDTNILAGPVAIGQGVMALNARSVDLDYV